jgi:hypothetical protein
MVFLTSPKQSVIIVPQKNLPEYKKHQLAVADDAFHIVFIENPTPKNPGHTLLIAAIDNNKIDLLTAVDEDLKLQREVEDKYTGLESYRENLLVMKEIITTGSSARITKKALGLVHDSIKNKNIITREDSVLITRKINSQPA